MLGVVDELEKVVKSPYFNIENQIDSKIEGDLKFIIVQVNFLTLYERIHQARNFFNNSRGNLSRLL